MLADLRYALRVFAKTPGLTLGILLSLALGIGVNTTALSWLESLVLRPLPGVERAGEIVVLASNRGGGGTSLPDVREFATISDTFTGTIASMPAVTCLTVQREPQWHDTQIVTANFFDLLGVRPALGRTFRADEDQHPGADNVVVISERLWRRRFGADPGIVGRTIDLNRHAFTIIGVAPSSFHGTNTPTRTDLWAPASMIAEVRNQSRNFLTRRADRGWHNLARLRPGVTVAQAGAAVAAADARFATAYPDTNRDIHHRVLPVRQSPWGAESAVGPTLRLLVVVSLGLQLIVTANVANLLLARATSRRKEIAVRLAAGASRQRLVRQFLTESALLATCGGALGVLLAAWLVNCLTLLLPAEIAARSDLHLPLGSWALLATVGLTVLTGVLFGFAPALQGTQADLNAVLKETARGSDSPAGRRMRRGLVVLEIALALLLLVGATLCVKGLQQARRINPGFDPDGVLLAPLQIGMNGYDQTTGLKFYRELRARIAAHPGVEEAALATWLPLGLAGCKGWTVTVEGYERPPNEDVVVEFAIISPRYLAAMRTPLVSGRDFDARDDAQAPRAAIVNEAFAHRYWPGLDPLGRRFRAGGQWRTIVGVVPTGKYNRLDEPAWPFFYLPEQQGAPDLDLGLVIRTKGEPLTFAPALRELVQQQDPAVALRGTLSLRAHSSMALFPQIMASKLLLVLGAAALALALVGIYAVLAYSVAQRTQEFGVRLALGASTRDFLVLVLGDAVRLAAAGVLLGTLGALAVGRLLERFLFGLDPFDLTTLGSTALLLGGVATLACLLPAIRATRVSPSEALRTE